MNTKLDHLRKQISKNRGGAVSAPRIEDVSINYGVVPGQVVLQFNKTINTLALTPEQAAGMIQSIQQCLDAPQIK